MPSGYGMSLPHHAFLTEFVHASIIKPTGDQGEEFGGAEAVIDVWEAAARECALW